MTSSPYPLARFRVGLAGVLLIQAFALTGHLDELFGRNGIVAWSVPQPERPGIPRLEWIETAGRSVGVPASWVVPTTFACYTAGLFGLLLGYRTRLCAGLAWLCHTALLTSSDMSTYGVDRFAQIGLFYCVVFPVGHAISLDHTTGRVRDEPVFAAWLGLRVLQAHVCVVYTTSGVKKATGTDWWNGEAIWRAVMGTPDCLIDCSFLATVPWLAKALCWTTLLLEAGVIAFVWHPRLRKLWLVGIVGMHSGIALCMGLWTFSATMIVFDIAAFGLIRGSPAHRHRECDLS